MLDRFGAALLAAGYTEEGIVGVTGAPDVEAIVSGDVAPTLDEAPAGDPMELLVRAFLMGRRVSARAMRAALPGIDIAELAAAGVVARRGDALVPLLRIMPFAGVLVASTPDNVGDEGVADDYVMSVGMSSITLANLTIRRDVDVALDLGCGGGVQALLLARHAQRVVAVDRNPRAVSLARLNARLNGATRIECAIGDFLEPLRESAFDLVTCNPPMVISPDSRYMYRDGSMPGDALCARLVATAPRHVREGGYAQVLCHWAHVAGERWQDRVAGWCAQTGCDAWVLQAEVSDPRTYAATWVGTTEQGSHEELSETLGRWMHWMAQERIEAIGSGLVTLRRTSRATPWFRADEGPDAIDGPCGDQVFDVFAARDFLDTHDDDALLRTRLRANPNLRLEVQSAPGQGAWRILATGLRIAGGLSWSAQVDATVGEFVGLCDGRRTAGELLAQLGVSVAALGGVRRLLERGFIASD